MLKKDSRENQQQGGSPLFQSQLFEVVKATVAVDTYTSLLSQLTPTIVKDS